MNRYYLVIWGSGVSAMITQDCEPELIDHIAPIAIKRAFSKLLIDEMDVK